MTSIHQQPKSPKQPIVYFFVPVTPDVDNNYKECKLIAEKLNALNINVLLPHELFTHIDTIGFKQIDFLRERVKRMIESDIILTWDGWEKDEICIAEVRIARELQQTVQHIVAFLQAHGKAN